MRSSLDQYVSAHARRAARSLQPLALITIVSIATAVGMSLLVTTPAEEHRSHAQADYQSARQMQQHLQAGRATVDELKDVWNLLPPRKDFSSLVLAISELARQDGVKIPGMNYSLEKADDGFALKVSMTFQAAGPYPGIRAFIHRLETTGPYLFIESLDAARSAGGGRLSDKAQRDGDVVADRTVVVFNIRVATFLRPDPRPPGRTSAVENKAI
jgi:hypothetical protein